MAHPTLIIEIAPDHGPLHTGPVWVAITTDVISIPSIRRGRQDVLSRFEAGTATVVLDNEAGTYTPQNNQSTYYHRLWPMCPIRIRATYSAVTYDLFRGFVESWEPEWEGGFTSTVTLTCVDGFKLLALSRVSSSLGAQDTHERIQAMLALAGWSVTYWSIDAVSFVPLPALTVTQTAALAHMQNVEETEAAFLYMGTDGILYWKQRNARGIDTRSITVQARFGYDPRPTIRWTLGDATLSVLGSTTILRGSDFSTIAEIPYLTADLSFDDRSIINDAQIATLSGTVLSANDAASRERYGPHAYAITLLSDVDFDAQERADLMVATYKTPQLRILTIRASGHQQDESWPYLLKLDLSDRVTVMVRPHVGSQIGQACWVEAVQHSNITDSTWETSYTLSLATT